MASPGGVGDGLPSLPDGEPVLARWFVLGMIPLVVIGLVVTVLVFVSMFGREEFTAAQRRPPGTASVTHQRGTAVLNEITELEPATGCATGVTLFGDEGARAATRRGLAATCQLLASGDFPGASAGMQAFIEHDGLLRIAVFEFSGTESSARVEEQRVVIELSPRFQFADATRSAPFILHELVHIAGPWPGEPVTAQQEVAATRVTAAACDRLAQGENSPLGCIDAATILATDDPVQEFLDAGY